MYPNWMTSAYMFRDPDHGFIHAFLIHLKVIQSGWINIVVVVMLVVEVVVLVMEVVVLEVVGWWG